MANNSQPAVAQASRPARGVKRLTDEHDLARQLFVKAYPSPGFEIEHVAEQAIAAAKVFTDILHR